MKLSEVMKELEANGTAQNRKVYARHGVKGEQFGVSYANLYKMQKKLKGNQSLAEELWATDNHDARILATLIADPIAMKVSVLDKWVKDVDNYGTSLAVALVVAKTIVAWKRVEKWTKAKNPWIATVGWDTLTNLAGTDEEASDDDFAPYLTRIESDIHSSPNRVKHSMNGALIAIGCRNVALEKQALAVAKKIGKVEVDHGETSCKTPDAASYIQKVKARKETKKKTAKSKK